MKNTFLKILGFTVATATPIFAISCKQDLTFSVEYNNDKSEKFFNDVLKEEKFVPYDIINGYEEATDDSFYFEYETDTNLAPENYLLLDIAEVTKKVFFKFLEYENASNEKHLKELNE